MLTQKEQEIWDKVNDLIKTENLSIKDACELLEINNGQFYGIRKKLGLGAKKTMKKLKPKKKVVPKLKPAPKLKPIPKKDESKLAMFVGTPSELASLLAQVK